MFIEPVKLPEFPAEFPQSFQLALQVPRVINCAGRQVPNHWESGPQTIGFFLATGGCDASMI